jgi:hypothetical protein
MAERLGVDSQKLQQLMADSPWDEQEGSSAIRVGRIDVARCCNLLSVGKLFCLQGAEKLVTILECTNADDWKMPTVPRASVLCV